MKYSSIIFDWDGTLAMTLHLWLEAYRTELIKLGFHYTDKVIVDDFFYEHDKTTIKYPDIKFENFIQNVCAYMVQHASSPNLYVGVHEILEKLQKNNVTMTLVSSSVRKLLKEALRHNNLDQYFSAIVAGDDVMRHKPDPEPFFNAIEIGKLDPKTTLVLGDSHNDMIAAKAAGLDSCLFLPEENKLFYDFETLKKTNPTYCVETLSDFAEMVVSA